MTSALLVVLLMAVVVAVLVGVVALVVVTRRRVDSTWVAAALAETKKQAWLNRDIDPALATAVIDRIRVLEQRPPSPGMIDEVLEICWRHREDSPALSTILVDDLRSAADRR